MDLRTRSLLRTAGRNSMDWQDLDVAKTHVHVLPAVELEGQRPLHPARAFVEYGRPLAVDANANPVADGDDGHLIPLAGLVPLLDVLRFRLDHPSPAVRLIQSADVVGRVDLRLKSLHADVAGDLRGPE